MRKQFTDEQLDQMMRTLVSDAALNKAEVNEIADSPQMLWAVKRQINQQKELSVSPWPPIAKFWRWLMIGVPTAAAAALLISFIVFKPINEVGVAGIIPVNNVASSQPKATEEPTVAKVENNKVGRKSITTVPVKFTTPKHVVNKTFLNPIVAKATSKTEIKTEFIALSYARNPESGQIVRVRVPSSMMVTLGLVANVEKPSNLVDAEVLVGDDGLSRAIRFIR